MEGVLLHASAAKPVSPYKSHIKNPKKIMNPPLIASRPYDQDFLASKLYPNGVLQVPPPFLFHSYPPFSLQPPPVQPQPPLLPLPTSNPHHITTLSRGLSCPPVNRRGKNNPKKPSKSNTFSPMKEGKNPGKIAPSTGSVTVSSDPKDVMPKKVTKVSSSVPSVNVNSISSINRVGSFKSSCVENEEMMIDKFSGSVVFTISPPPSSLPLPTFSLRPKLSCNVEAAGVDTGATDNLRRLLRLR